LIKKNKWKVLGEENLPEPQNPSRRKIFGAPYLVEGTS